MNKRDVLVIIGGALVLAATFGINVAKSSYIEPMCEKVTLCHATGSQSNPYVEISVAPEAVFKQGHDQHQGDIVPPFDYSGGHYAGLNWDTEHITIWENGCDPVSTATPEIPTDTPVAPTDTPAEPSATPEVTHTMTSTAEFTQTPTSTESFTQTPNPTFTPDENGNKGSG